jgi:hypothetical protein
MSKRLKIETLLIATMMALSIIGAQAGTRMHPVAESRAAHQVRPDFWRSAFCRIHTIDSRCSGRPFPGTYANHI